MTITSSRPSRWLPDTLTRSPIRSATSIWTEAATTRDSRLSSFCFPPGSRLLDETGDKEGAQKEYQRFLDLWKNADEGLPELEEARAYVGN